MMITSENLSAVLSAVAWPIVALVSLFVLKRHFGSLVSRLTKAKLPGGAEVSFLPYGDASIDKDTPIDKSASNVPVGPPSTSKEPLLGVTPPTLRNEPPIDSVRWSNSGNLFWIGHDLMWTADVALRGGPAKSIAHGLRQSLHHVRSLGLSNTPIESKLVQINSEVCDSLNQDWTASQRNSLANKLIRIIREIGDRAEAQQPGFQPSPT